jgi:hypothetical protein
LGEIWERPYSVFRHTKLIDTEWNLIYMIAVLNLRLSLGGYAEFEAPPKEGLTNKGGL